MAATVKFKRGPRSGVGGAGCLPNNLGEVVVTTDTNELFVSNGTSFNPVRFNMENFFNAPYNDTNYFLLYDVSETNNTCKKILGSELKIALTPENTDTMVKVASNTTANYLDNVLNVSGTGFSKSGTENITLTLDTTSLVFDCGSW